MIVTDTSEYLHEYITQPHVTSEYRITHAILLLSASLKDVPTRICDSQLAEIEAVRKIFVNWRTLKYLPPQKPTVLPLIPRQAVVPVRYPKPTSKGGQENNTAITSKGVVQQQVITIPKIKQVTINSKGDQEPIAKRTRSRIESETLQPSKQYKP